MKPKRTVLFSPVTQIIDGDGLHSLRLANVSHEIPNDGTAQMTGVERLGNVWTTELDHDCFSFSGLVATIISVHVTNDRQEQITHNIFSEAKVQESVGYGDVLDIPIRLDLQSV